MRSSCRAARSTAAANINLVGIGDVDDYPRAQARFPGSFGSSYLYFVVPRVILFREEHTPRTLVERWISSARPVPRRPTCIGRAGRMPS